MLLNMILNGLRVDNRINIKTALEVAAYFGVSDPDALNIADEMIHIINSSWISFAKECGLSRIQIEEMRPAFGLSMNPKE